MDKVTLYGVLYIAFVV